jgi:hypothetical protein
MEPDPDDPTTPPRIEFFTEPRHAYLLKDAPPLPAGSALPQWWRDTDTHRRAVTRFQVYPPELKLRRNATIKACPAIHDYLSGGFVLPLWADFAITLDGDAYRWESQRDEFVIERHDRDQYEKLPNEGFPLVLKFRSPWYCRTSPGYSIRVLPCFYHFDHLWRALPGVIHSDVVHQTHVNVLFEASRAQMVLPQGTPLAHIVPFRRERYQLDLHVASAEDLESVEATRRHTTSFFHGDFYPRAKGTM